MSVRWDEDETVNYWNEQKFHFMLIEKYFASMIFFWENINSWGVRDVGKKIQHIYIWIYLKIHDKGDHFARNTSRADIAWQSTVLKMFKAENHNTWYNGISSQERMTIE